jgi:hypothetical protein
MTKMQIPHSIKCLKAIEAYVGGRKQLAVKLGITESAINQWVWNQRVSQKHILNLCELSGNKYSAEDLLGKFDKKKAGDSH